MYSLFWKFENEYTMLFENRLAEKYSLAISCENRELKKYMYVQTLSDYT